MCDNAVENGYSRQEATWTGFGEWHAWLQPEETGTVCGGETTLCKAYLSLIHCLRRTKHPVQSLPLPHPLSAQDKPPFAKPTSPSSIARESVQGLSMMGKVGLLRGDCHAASLPKLYSHKKKSEGWETAMKSRSCLQEQEPHRGKAKPACMLPGEAAVEKQAQRQVKLCVRFAGVLSRLLYCKTGGQL